jgi:ribosome biogenesis protein SSF1/2
VQIGPRMSLEVVKVEEGLCDGKVLFHAFEERSEAAVAAGDEKQEAARKAAAEKEARRKQQVPWRLCD